MNVTRNFQGDYRHRDRDHDFRHRDHHRDFGHHDRDRHYRNRDYNRGYGGFGEFGGPFIGGLAGSLIGNVLFPGHGYGEYPQYGYPPYGYPPYRYQPYGYYDTY